MGWDPSAYLYVGIEVALADLFDPKEIETSCGHAEAQGRKFCPECGQPPRKAMRWTLKPVVGATLTRAPWHGEERLHTLLDGCFPKPVEIRSLSRDEEKAPTILGALVAEDSPYDTRRAQPVPLAAFTAATEVVRAYLSSIGIHREPSLFVVLG